jgi:predicted methyltransferase
MRKLQPSTLACIFLVAIALITACSTTPHFDRDAAIAQAIAAPDRPVTDTTRDINRHPAELLAFSRVMPSEYVLDIGSGGGYFTRLLSSMVGSKGQVIAHDAPAYVKNIATQRDALIASRPNISGMLTPFEALEGNPNSYDLVTIILMYHDIVHLGDRERMNKRIYELLKPGGRLLVVDHAAPIGSGLRDTNTLHRIDPQLVTKDMETAGLRKIDESKVLSNPQDDMTLVSFAPKFKWKTNQFVLLFEKPK